MTTVTYWNDDPVATYGPRGQLQGSDIGRKPNKHSTILSLLMGGVFNVMFEVMVYETYDQKIEQ